jgi:hypothetical protein
MLGRREMIREMESDMETAVVGILFVFNALRIVSPIYEFLIHCRVSVVVVHDVACGRVLEDEGMV